MKIKHWQGYGCVTATKLGRRIIEDYFGNKSCELQIRVKGNHEWGLERNDHYDVFHWLVKRFDKNCTDPYSITSIAMNDYYVKEGTLDVEVCDYTITYKL